MDVRFRILGPVEVCVAGRALPLGGRRASTVLAVLLLGANRVVSVDRVIDDVWGDEPPPTARGLVQSYVSRLRARLRSAGAPDVIATRPDGYTLRAEHGQVDLHEFDDLVREAERADVAGRPDLAAGHLRSALALWRGAALAGTASETLARTAAAGLEERRLDVLERRIDADLRLGRHAAVVPEVVELVARHPLRERALGLLMLALYRCERPAESLRVCSAARERLRRELGSELQPALQDLEQRIRSGDLSLLVPDATQARPGGDAPRPPCLLPPDVGDWIGRPEEVATTTGALLGGRDGAAVLPMVALSGPPGVGKTTLAVHVAHLLRGRFPDGQLFVDLGGAEGNPVAAEQVHAAFLRALGVDEAAVPHDRIERAAAYRASLTGRRVLIVLDNAADEAQVRPLLPGDPGCAVVVTSRAALGGLGAAEVVRLDVLEPEAALDLLSSAAGHERVLAEPADARSIVDLCGGLPLALRVAGARLRVRPHWRLARLAERLRDERRRLDELRIGDLEVRASLALSYRGLDEDARRAFRALGLLPASDFPARHAAALLDVGTAAAEDVLERLVDAQLLQSAGEDGVGQARYRCHSLVRTFAAERCTEHDPPAARLAAVERVLAAQLALGELARAALSPGDASLVPRGAAPRRPPDPSLAAVAERTPVLLLEVEREDLRGAVEMACAAGLHELAWELACSLPTFVALRGYWYDWRESKLLALAATRAAGNGAGVAHTLYALGMSALAVGDVGDAHRCFEEALGRYRDLGSAIGQRRTDLALGLTALALGDVDTADRLYRRCHRSFEEADEWYGAALALHGIANVQRRQGRYAEADANLQRCLGVFRDVGEPYWEASVLRALGEVAWRSGRHPDAVGFLERCLRIAGVLNDSPLEARVLYRLSELHRAEGRVAAATACLERCVAVSSAQHFVVLETRARALLGELGQPGAAGPVRGR